MAKVDGDLLVPGTITCGGINIPANSIGDAEFDGTDRLTCSKQSHQYNVSYRQPKTSTVVAERAGVHIAYGNGEITAFRACLIDTVNLTGATVTVKVRKNGTDITAAAAVITDAHTLRQVIDGTVTPTSFVADDVLEIDVTVAAGGGTIGKGLVVSLVLREDPE